MTDAERLSAIFDRLGKIDRDLATHSANMTGELARVGDRLENLDERVRIQNGRVTKAEYRLNELETQARIAERDDREDDARHDAVAARIWQFISGAGLVALGALLGYFL